MKELGRFDEALTAFNKTLELTPDAYGAYVNLVDTKNFTSTDDPHLKAMEAYKAEFGKLPEEREMHLRFALSKAYEDLKRHDDAFEHMKRGCELKRKTIKYDEREILGYFDRIKNQITKDVIQKQSGNGVAGDLPIFVLGMPRSGTTLVEQIISSHPRVKAAGELRDLNETISSVRDSKGNIAPFPEFVPVLKSGEVAKIADLYLKRLAKHGPLAERITDKMRPNFYFAGRATAVFSYFVAFALLSYFRVGEQLTIFIKNEPKWDTLTCPMIKVLEIFCAGVFKMLFIRRFIND